MLTISVQLKSPQTRQVYTRKQVPIKKRNQSVFFPMIFSKKQIKINIVLGKYPMTFKRKKSPEKYVLMHQFVVNLLDT